MPKKDKAKSSKKIAGVKLPKVLRTGAIGTLLGSLLGRDILADALLAAAGAAAAALVKKRPTAGQVADAGEAAVDMGAKAAAATRDSVQDAAGAVAGLVAEAARQFLPGSVTGADEARPGKGKRYEHLAGRDAKDKKDKHRGTSKH